LRVTRQAPSNDSQTIAKNSKLPVKDSQTAVKNTQPPVKNTQPPPHREQPGISRRPVQPGAGRGLRPPRASRSVDRRAARV